jgi:hypothetical protein
VIRAKLFFSGGEMQRRSSDVREIDGAIKLLAAVPRQGDTIGTGNAGGIWLSVLSVEHILDPQHTDHDVVIRVERHGEQYL